ncbi:DNA polymerase I [Anaerosporobacter sp.]|uniref:DNA polymerase I n=1 Tax=Anaerosporobacter sp. TaxID=1872529 RepID=UPI00286F81C4|nr:DNA polymerase I [Anaerosporobacter sp.]
MSDKIVLIDGNSIINRAFYGVPDLTNSEGIHTNAIYGFINIMLKILEEEQAQYLTVAFDVKHPTFRHIRYPEYKGTRKGMPDELREQVPLLKDVLHAMGIRTVEKAGYEADDILGTIATRCSEQGMRVSLVSGDRDLLQLATEQILIRIPKTKRGGTEIENYNTAEVIEKYQVSPAQIIDLKGLMGDASDNIPGVPGIGEKTAAKILTAFETVENAYAHIDEVMPNKARESLREHYDLAVLSKELATIKIDCELDYELEEAKMPLLFTPEAFALFKRFEFKSLLNRFETNVSRNDKVEEKFIEVTSKEEADKVFQSIEQLKEAKNLEELVADGVSTDRVGFMLAIIGNEVVGAALTYSEKVSYYIQVNKEISAEYIIERANIIIEKNIMLSVVSLKEMLLYIRATNESKIYDMGLASYVLNPLKDTYHYDDIARDYLEMTFPSREELFGKTKEKDVFESQKETYKNYICYHSYTAYLALEKLSATLHETESLGLFVDIEMPLIYTLYDMEYRGIRVNKEALKEYGNQLEVRIKELEKNIYEHVGEEFNINSPKQLGVILFEKMHMPFAKKTKTGYSTSADVLEKLRCEDPVINEILEYRQLTKLKSTYADGLAVYIADDNRIHGKFNQTITATGRISSTEPNLQNIPIRMELGRQIRKVFIPEEEYVFLDADYSQIELRVLAHMSADERLIDAYKQEQDIHKITASQVFHTPLDEVTSAQRSDAKAVNFGIVYGISSFGLGQDLNITKKEADMYIKQYFATYPKVKEFLDNLVGEGKEKGYVTSLFNRRRPIPELNSSNFMQRSFGERVAMNSPIQGTAADIIKIAMIRVNQKLKDLKLKSRLLLQIHDELLIETHKDEIEQVAAILKEEMQGAVNLSIPMEVEVKQGNSWYEAK